MPQCHIQLVLGELPEEMHGQWVEATTIIEEAGAFHFRADLCRQLECGEFSIHTVATAIPHQLTAELLLALVAFCARAPFTPSKGGLRINVSGDPASTGGEVARIMEPQVRFAVNYEEIPEEVADRLNDQLRRVGEQRELLHRVLQRQDLTKDQ